MRTIVVVPTYNERDTVPVLCRALHQSLPEADVLIVDDNSPDGTGEIADRLCAETHGKVSVLHRPAKMGLGPAYVAGFRYALAHGYDLIVQMDADLSHDPKYLPALLERARACDLVLGSRYVKGINVVNWDFKRLLLSKLASYYVQFVTGMPFTDPTGGFKCWRREALNRLELHSVFANGYLFQIETTYRAFRSGCRIGEESITFHERTLGRSKLDVKIIREALFGVLRLRLEPAWWFSWRARRAARRLSVHHSVAQ